MTKPANIDSFEELVKKGTNGVGVDLMMADGGFSVEGQENIQVINRIRFNREEMMIEGNEL